MEEDQITGTLGNDILNGTNGNDRFIPLSGNDIIDGRSGNDTVVFFGAHADYTIRQNSDSSWTISDSEEAADNQGTNIIRNIETIEFTRTGTFTPEELLAEQTNNNQTIKGTAASESLSGSNGDDRILGGNGADSLYGGLGDDRLVSGKGDDFVNGGVGIDTLKLRGNISDFTITENQDGSYTVADNRTGRKDQGTDTVWNVERLQFKDGVLNLNSENDSSSVTSFADLGEDETDIAVAMELLEDGFQEDAPIFVDDFM